MTTRDLQALYLSAEQRWMDRWVEGPTLESSPLRRGDAAPEARVQDESGETVALSAMWSRSTALILLWRHLGCGCGIERITRLREEMPAYEAENLNVAICAPAEPERIAVYKERYGVPVPMYSDPGYEVHRAFGLGHWSVEQVLYDAPDEYCELGAENGKRFQDDRRAQGRRLVDDPWMQSGEFVVDTTGTIRVAHVYNYCEDYPDPRVFSAAARLAG